MRNPLSGLTEMVRLPADLARDAQLTGESVRRLLPAIEEIVATLSSGLAPLFADIVRIRDTVVPQQERVAHIEHMTEDLSQRIVRMEQVLVDLQARLEDVMQLLPDPKDDRGALTKAKDAITGG